MINALLAIRSYSLSYYYLSLSPYRYHHYTILAPQLSLDTWRPPGHAALWISVNLLATWCYPGHLAPPGYSTPYLLLGVLLAARRVLSSSVTSCLLSTLFAHNLPPGH